VTGCSRAPVLHQQEREQPLALGLPERGQGLALDVHGFLQREALRAALPPQALVAVDEAAPQAAHACRSGALLWGEVPAICDNIRALIHARTNVRELLLVSQLERQQHKAR